MGARVIRRPDPSARKRKEALTIWAILTAVALPVLLAYILVAADMRGDLSELKPTGFIDDNGAIAVGWPELEGPGAWGRVRMIGYMVDGYRPLSEGASVGMFILLPDAGQLLHPAHRIPNQMVEVRSRLPVLFRYRQLVWAVGTLTRTLSIRGDDKAAWAMSDAKVEPAEPREIGKWFLP